MHYLGVPVLADDLPKCTIWPNDSPGQGGSFEIVLEKTRAAACSVRVLEFASPTAGVPVSDNTYDLFDIEMAGLTMVAKTSAMWLTPTVTIAFSTGVASHQVSIMIEHSIFKDGSTVYPLSADDYANVLAWLKSCAFPSC
jgi:hypothetical protein